MNQTTHFTQWKNLTDEQKAGFDFEGYKYQVQGEDCCFYEVNNPTGLDGLVYRLKIEPEKWYFCEVETIPNCRPENTIKLGEHLTGDFIEACHIVRPAKPSEMPKPKQTLEDRVKAEYSGFDVVMCDWYQGMYCLELEDTIGREHHRAQSMRKFVYYIYFQDGELYLRDGATYNGLLPIAAQFSRGEE